MDDPTTIFIFGLVYVVIGAMLTEVGDISGPLALVMAIAWPWVLAYGLGGVIVQSLKPTKPLPPEREMLLDDPVEQLLNNSFAD